MVLRKRRGISGRSCHESESNKIQQNKNWMSGISPSMKGQKISLNCHESKKAQPSITAKRVGLRRWTQGTAAIAFAALFAVGKVGAQVNHFSGASETPEQLLEFFEQTGDRCVHSRSRDVQVAVACYSMGIYGMALNERGMCFGKENEANAAAEWHACESGSRHFPELEIPSGFQ